MLDQAILAVPAEDGGLLGSHMVGPVRAVVVRAHEKGSSVVLKLAKLERLYRGFISRSVETGTVHKAPSLFPFDCRAKRGLVYMRKC